MICELKNFLEAILCFHQGFLIKYSSTLSRLSIVTVSSPARNYNICFSPSLSHLQPPGLGRRGRTRGKWEILSFLSKNKIILNILIYFFSVLSDRLLYLVNILSLSNIFPRNILRLLCCEDKILKGEEMISDGVAPRSRLRRWSSYCGVTRLESWRVRLIVSWTMLVLRTKSWMEKVAGRAAHCSLHQTVMFLRTTDRDKLCSGWI